MQNPWLNINWENTIAECDNGVLTIDYCKSKCIDTEDLPEPYTGNVDSNVVCLNLNPGLNKCSCCFRSNEQYLKLTKETLELKIDHSLWFDIINCEKGAMHSGCDWWQKKTKQLCDAIKPKVLNMFVIEFFPYHSEHAFTFPNLPSNNYRNYLLKQAMDDGKLIVIMRGEKRWYNIKEDSIGYRLKNEYENKIVMTNPRSVYFSEKTIGSKWDLLINSLKRDIVHKHRNS